MRKETIIEIILSTMEEMRKLTETFADKENIPQPFIDLLMTKYSTLGKEIQLLEFWKEEAAGEESVVKEPVAEIEVSPEPQPVVEPIAEVKEEIKPEPKAETPVVVKSEPVVEVKPEPVAVEVTKTTAEPVKVVMPKKEVDPVVPVAPSKPVVSAKTAKAVSSKDTIEYGTPVADIRKAVGINDRFLFQRELFGGDGNKLNETLDAINACASYEEAHEMLKVFGWDETDANVEGFLKAVHRRFL